MMKRDVKNKQIITKIDYNAILIEVSKKSPQTQNGIMKIDNT